MVGDLRIEPARSDEVDVVLSLLNEAAQWVIDRGAEGWQPGQWRRERLLETIESGETYLAREGDTVVGTVTLQWSDEVWWPGAPADAGYVHRLAVGKDHHGRGLGVAMIEWAARGTLTRGRPFLRLDCAARNPVLRAYYESLGFALRGERSLTGRGGTFHAALYEEALGNGRFADLSAVPLAERGLGIPIKKVENRS